MPVEPVMVVTVAAVEGACVVDDPVAGASVDPGASYPHFV